MRGERYARRYRIEVLDNDYIVGGDQQFEYRFIEYLPTIFANESSTIGSAESEQLGPRRSGTMFAVSWPDSVAVSPNDMTGRVADFNIEENSSAPDYDIENIDRAANQFVAHIAGLRHPRDFGIERSRNFEEYDDWRPNLASGS